MNTDIRIALGFLDHPKTMKLKRRLGLEGIEALLRLWIWAAQNKPDGDFSAMDSEDVEIAARWNGEEGKLVQTLEVLGWIDATGNGYLLHDWDEHNSWAAEACDRSAKARLSRLKQVNAAGYDECHRRGMESLSVSEYNKWKKYNPAKAGESQADEAVDAGGMPSGSVDCAGDIPADAEQMQGEGRGDLVADSGDAVANASQPHSDSTATAGVALAPSPSPSPAPIAEKEEGTNVPLSKPQGGSDADSKSPPDSLPKEKPAESPKKSAKAQMEEELMQGVVDLYNRMLVDEQPEGRKLPRCTKLSDKRKGMLRSRMKQNAELRNLDGWLDYFHRVNRSPYLMGEVNSWNAAFDWLMDTNNMLKVKEGNFLPNAEKKAAKKLPALHRAVDFVQRYVAQGYKLEEVLGRFCEHNGLAFEDYASAVQEAL